MQLELGGILDRDDAVGLGDGRGERVQQRRLTGAGTARDHDVELGADAEPEELDRPGGQRAEIRHVLEGEALARELPDRHQRARQRQRRDDRVDAGAVGQAGIDHRRRLVDAAADLGDDLVDDPAEVRVVGKANRRLVEPSLALDPDLAGAVDHDFRDRVVAEQALEGAVAENVVRNLVGEPRPVVARDPGLCLQAMADRRHHVLARLGGIDGRARELGSELADHLHVDGVLEVGERLARRRRDLERVRVCETLVEFHLCLSAGEPSEQARLLRSR